jgi:hypothetical protein
VDDKERTPEEWEDDIEVRRMIHEFTVQSLLFAFDALEWLGYRPSSNGDEFWIGDAEGNPLPRSEVDRLAEVTKDLMVMAPLAVNAMHTRGTPGEAGTDAGGAFLEAYARWTERGALGD